MSIKILVTGSDRGSKIAWSFIKFILKTYKTKPIFISPKNFNKNIEFNGLIISGGIDINPSLYGETSYKFSNFDIKRDEMELFFLEKALMKNLPVFGICRGMQLINVFFEGTLHFDIKDLDLNHPHPKTPLPLKDVFIKKDSHLYKIIMSERIKVNALHHQAVDKIGLGLKKSAYDKNHIIQAIEHETLNILGVQWHPEFMPYLKSSQKIFNNFIKKAKNLELS
ncbi:gamma-glutamyl-gamma-aminobutyrate hydrolase family protein [Nitrosophilus kaiyonis]|uniref:gamma-glutamyl-gamma-aminobutyrate hydrolase family protein n=1 Tax=Nitrosophilus kaiyonis TaxID=2930200 RepID=UPI002490324C|nr:gamma-glutamyl-gamma-aminobutyrate hydrolase family protein [Nitrosophilus kaiyonis]